jgi:hypothetical protein
MKKIQVKYIPSKRTGLFWVIEKRLVRLITWK